MRLICRPVHRIPFVYMLLGLPGKNQTDKLLRLCLLPASGTDPHHGSRKERSRGLTIENPVIQSFLQPEHGSHIVQAELNPLHIPCRRHGMTQGNIQHVIAHFHPALYRIDSVGGHFLCLRHLSFHLLRHRAGLLCVIDAFHLS